MYNWFYATSEVHPKVKFTLHAQKRFQVEQYMEFVFSTVATSVLLPIVPRYQLPPAISKMFLLL